jgi:hypothetical protein
MPALSTAFPPKPIANVQWTCQRASVAEEGDPHGWSPHSNGPLDLVAGGLGPLPVVRSGWSEAVVVTVRVTRQDAPRSPVKGTGRLRAGSRLRDGALRCAAIRTRCACTGAGRHWPRSTFIDRVDRNWPGSRTNATPSTVHSSQ